MTENTLESLSVKSLSKLESLIETSGELFHSLLEYSQTKTEESDDMEKEKRQNVIEYYEKYKKFEKELRRYLDDIVKLENERKEVKKENTLIHVRIANGMVLI